MVAGGCLTCLFPKANRFGPWFSTLAVLAADILILPPAFLGMLRQGIGSPLQVAGLSLALDPLAAFFVFVIAFVSLLASIYAQGYLRPYRDKGSDIRINLLLLNVLIAAMILVATADDTLSFLFIWEIMTLASFLLVIYDHRQAETLRAGVKYLVAMHVGYLFLAVGFILAASAAGSTSFPRIAQYFATKPAGTMTVVLLLFLGFSLKAGFIPFHFWLPEAHPAAPTHVSAVMSAVMIKTGIYGILRTIGLFPHDSIPFAACFLAIAALSALYGMIYALSQHDLKKLLAYCSVENIGLIGLGIGLGMLGQALGRPGVAFLGYAGALLHTAGHAISKSLLFFAAGSVYQNAHTREIDRLGGLGKTAPWTAAGFLIGSLAIGGLPPFNGFVSEFLIYASFLSGVSTASSSTALLGLAGLVVLALVGGLAVACFTKAFGVIFLGEPRRPLPEPAGEPWSMIFPMAVLALLALAIGVFPAGPARLLAAPVAAVAGEPPADTARLFSLCAGITRVCLALLGIAAVLALIRSRLLRGRAMESAATWGCGYHRATPRMQYTGSSYASGILSLCGRLVGWERHLAGPQGIFPAGGNLQNRSRDILDASLIRPAQEILARFLGRFRWIQHGDLRNYLLYGLAFLAVIIIMAFGG